MFTYKYDISIVIAYMNRKEQFIRTLNMFELSYKNYNYEVIIVDDGSTEDHKLTDVIKVYTFPIKLIEITSEEKGSRINPCIAYNKGFKAAEGKIVIIQNPECYHVGDLCKYVLLNLHPRDYFTFSCYSANSKELTLELLENTSLINDTNYEKKNKEYGQPIKPFYRKKKQNQIWYNHISHRNCNLHFCSAMYNDNLKIIGGFDELFAQGHGYDDNVFLSTIRYNLGLNVITVPVEAGFVIHQWHSRSYFNDTMRDMIKKNKILFKNIELTHNLYEFNYPKLLHLYWDGSNFSYMNLLTIISFRKYHPCWKINVYCPKNRSKNKSWTTNEQKDDYTGKNYFPEIYGIPNVNIHYIDFDLLPFKHKNASEVIKSDYFRYYILNKYGGLWSDFDIIYINNIEKYYHKQQKDMIIYRYSRNNTLKNIIRFFKGKGKLNYIYPVGLFLCRPSNTFLTTVLGNIDNFYDEKEYQCLGARMFSNYEDYINNNNTICVDDAKAYLPIKFNELEKLYDNHKIKIKDLTGSFGVHWFNGAKKSKIFQNDLDRRDPVINCLMDELILNSITSLGSDKKNLPMYFLISFAAVTILFFTFYSSTLFFK